MTIEANRPEISKENYMTAGAGALIGGAGTYGVINTRLNSIAKKTVKALNGTSTDCDAFVKKHDELLSRAVDSKKGFFGKVNKALKNLTGSANGDLTAVRQASDPVIDGYTLKAAKKINSKYKGEDLEKGINNLRNKFLSKDISKSFKDVKKFETIVKVSGAALLGVIGAFTVRNLIAKHMENKAPKEPAKSIH